jgi:hypothetical protein
MGRLHIHSFIISLLDGVDLYASFPSSFRPGGKSSECLISREKERVIITEPLDAVVKAICPALQRRALEPQPVSVTQNGGKKSKKKTKSMRKKSSRLILAMRICKVK